MSENVLKSWVKRLHGGVYQILLPIFVQPPAVMSGGRVYTLPRLEVIRFLDRWKDKIYGRVLDVGVGTWTLPRQMFSDRCEYIATDCFEHPNIDVISDIEALTLVFERDSFDFVLCTEVVEHVPRPWQAVRELYAVLKPGGILLLTTPFNFRLHGNQQVTDYWRISADGLRQLLEKEAGFHKVEICALGHPRFPYLHTVVAYK